MANGSESGHNQDWQAGFVSGAGVTGQKDKEATLIARQGKQSPPTVVTSHIVTRGQDGEGNVSPVIGRSAALPDQRSPGRSPRRRKSAVAAPGGVSENSSVSVVSEGRDLQIRQPWPSKDGQTKEAESRVPLVLRIEDCGDERPREEKVEVIARAADMLEILGVHQNLVDEIRAASEVLEPLGSQVLARKPDAYESKGIQGRGIFYSEVPVVEGEKEVKATVYVKGIGNGENFSDEDALFSGLPGENDELFFDKPTVSRPRIKGAEYLPVALLELINQSEYFAQQAIKNNWTSLADAIKEGATIPLFVTHFKEASEYFQQRVDRERENATDERVRQALDWGDRYFGIGTVTQIVSSSERLSKGKVDSVEEGIAVINRVIDPEIYRNVGKALRKLYEVGGKILMPPSAHAQNVSPEGVAVADAADWVSLSDLKGYTDADPGSHLISDILPELQSLVRKTGFLYKLFNRGKNLTPTYLPLPELGIRGEQFAAMQENFWGEILAVHDDEKRDAHPNAIRLMSSLMPFLHTEFILASSLRLAIRNQHTDTAAFASQRKTLLERFSHYSVPEEYADILSGNMSAREVYALIRLINNDFLPIQAMNKFLSTGNLEDVQEPERAQVGKNERIVDVITLALAIMKIPDVPTRDTLLQLAGQYYGKRDIPRLIVQPDQIAAFEGVQTHIVRYFIENKRYFEASLILDLLQWSREKGFRDAYRSNGYPETSELYYPRILTAVDTEDPECILEIYTQCAFDKSLYEFAAATKPLPDDQIQEIGTAMQSDENVLFNASAEQLPTSGKIIRMLLGNYLTKGPDRVAIASWLSDYAKIRGILDEKEVTAADKQAAVDGLDSLAEITREKYPELAFGHANIMAAYFRDSDPARAEVYEREVRDYYQSKLHARIEKFEAEPLFKPPTPEEKRMQYEKLGEMYAHANLDFISDIYFRLADGEIQRFTW